MKTPPVPARGSARGRSLIELMVAILIGSLVLAGVLVITAGSTSIGRRSESLGSLNDSGQVALQLLAADIRMAGYSAPRTYYAPGYITKIMPHAGVRGCDAGFANNAAADMSVLACGNAATGAAIAVAYEADAFNSILVGGGVPSDCRAFGLVASVAGVGNAARPDEAVDTMSEAPAYWRVENRYFVGNGPDGEPSLLCTGSGGAAPYSSSVALIRGVESMALSYGVATGALNPSRSDQVLVVTPNIATYMTATQIDTTWAAEPPEVRWQRVISVRACMVIRGDVGSAEPGASYLNCNGANTAINDRRARRAVHMTMNLRNRTMSVDGTIGLGGV